MQKPIVSTSTSPPRCATGNTCSTFPGKSTVAGVRKTSDSRLPEVELLSTDIGLKIPGIGHAVQSPPSEIYESLMPTSPSPPRRVTSNTRSTFPRKSTVAGVRKTSDSRPTEAALLLTGIGPKISGVGHAFQSPTSEMQGLPVPISPTPPLRMTGDRSKFPDKSTQRRKRHPPGSVSHSAALPTLPVNPSLKRKRDDNEIPSAGSWVKRKKAGLLSRFRLRYSRSRVPVVQGLCCQSLFSRKELVRSSLPVTELSFFWAWRIPTRLWYRT
jgi:hypothetical protein